MPKKVEKTQIPGLAGIAAEADGHQLLAGVKGTIQPYGRRYDLGVPKDSHDLKMQLLLPWMVLVLDKIANGESVLGLRFSGRNVLVTGATYYELNEYSTPTLDSVLFLESRRGEKFYVDLEIKQTLWLADDHTYGEYRLSATLRDKDTRAIAWTTSYPVVRADNVTSYLRAIGALPKHPEAVTLLASILEFAPGFCMVDAPVVFHWPPLPLGACGDDQMVLLRTSDKDEPTE